MSEQNKDTSTALPEALHKAATAQPQSPEDKLAAEAAARGLTVKQYRYGYDMKGMG